MDSSIAEYVCPRCRAEKSAGRCKACYRRYQLAARALSQTSGHVYMFWAEGSTRFKIGFTTRTVARRALDVEGCSPLDIRIVGARPGTRADECRLHRRLAPFRLRNEWFSLPEEIVWQLLGEFREAGTSCLPSAAAVIAERARRVGGSHAE